TVYNPSIPNAIGGDGTDIGALEVDHVLRFTDIRRSGPDIFVRFTSVSDKVYQLQSKSDVREAQWTNLPQAIAGSGGMVTATNIGAAGTAGRRFYRAFEQH